MEISVITGGEKVKNYIVILFISMLIFSSAIYAGEIHDACKAGDLSKVKALLEQDPSLLQSKTEEGKSPLHMATGWGKCDIVEYLISVGADINARNNNGGTPIHVAASQNQPDCARILISHGANVNDIRTLGKMTPLLIAVYKSNYEVAKVLLELGADIDAKTESGENALMIAKKRNDQKMIDFLTK